MTTNYTKGPFQCDGIPKTNHASAKLKTIWIPPNQFLLAQTSGAATTLVGGGAGDPVSSGSLSSSNIGGWAFDADGDLVTCIIPVPYDMDVTASVAAKALIHWASASQTGDTVDLKLHYGEITPGAEALAAPGTAVAFTQQAWVADDYTTEVAGATIPADTFTLDRYMTIAVEADDLSSGIGAGEIAFLGVKLTYTKAWL